MKVPRQGSTGIFPPYAIPGIRDRILIRRGCPRNKPAQGVAEPRKGEEEKF